MSGLGSTSNVRFFILSFLWSGWASVARPCRPQAPRGADLRGELCLGRLFFEGSVFVEGGDFARAVEDRQRPVAIFAHPHFHFYEMVAVAAFGDLQHAVFVADRIVLAD